MSTRYGAWRFAFHTTNGQVRPAGISLSAKGAIELAQDAAVVRQAILLLISTRPGERVMRPEYGCYLFRLAFSPNDDTTAGLAIHYVRQAIERWEPRIRISKLDANRNEAHVSWLDIHLQYCLRMNMRSENLAVRLDTSSGRILL
jgi:phage baseplate assembly protein W